MSKPIIYQILPRLFGNRDKPCTHNGTIEENGCGKFNDFTPAVLKKIKDMGFTHIWYTGVIRHATTTDYSKFKIPNQHPAVVKGKAGSAYAICDYYDVDPDLAVDPNNRMKEYEALLERTHQAGLKVIMDFVPNHVARQYKSICKPAGVKDLGEDDDSSVHFSPSNNFYYNPGQSLVLPNEIKDIKDRNGNVYTETPAKSTGNDHFDQYPTMNDWYETVKLNYGIDYLNNRTYHFDPIPNTWIKMTDILLYWSSKNIDGFRCDMAEMVPSQFWSYATDRVKAAHPNLVFIGEVYNPAQYREYICAGFNYLYDKVGMYDCVRDCICHRRPTNQITCQWQSTSDIIPHMLYFLENHDEQRIGSDFFAGMPAHAIPGFVTCALMNSNPYMVYAGGEYGEHGMDDEGFSGRDGRTTIFDYWSPRNLRLGYYDYDSLDGQEHWLYDTHRNVLNIAHNEKAINEGAFFDLMYVNPQLGERQFAYLRKVESDQSTFILVVSNYNDCDVSLDITIPDHAFNSLKISPGNYKVTDLLTNNSFDASINPLL